MIVTEYTQLCELERRKSTIYSHLFTTFFLLYFFILAYYFYNPIKNSPVMLLCPMLTVVWYSFISFNFLYLRYLRLILSELEKHLDFKIRWYSNFYTQLISKRASPILFVVCTVIIILLTIINIPTGFYGLLQFMKNFTPYDTMSEFQLRSMTSVYYMIYIFSSVLSLISINLFTFARYTSGKTYIECEMRNTLN